MPYEENSLRNIQSNYTMWNHHYATDAMAAITNPALFSIDRIKAEKENYDVSQYHNAYQKAYDFHKYHQTISDQTEKTQCNVRTSLGSCDDSGVVNNVSSENVSNSSTSTTPPNVYRSPTTQAETPNFYPHHQYFGKLEFPNSYYYPTNGLDQKNSSKLIGCRICST